jgi:hypothetical protein
METPTQQTRDFDAEMHTRIDAMAQNLIPDRDFGRATDKNARKVLLKPGAEKLLSAAGVSIQFTEVKSIITKELVAFGYSATLVRISDGVTLLSGAIGYATSEEPVYKKFSPLGCTNKIAKMAQKCCLVAAALIVCCASGEFTQDLDVEPARQPPRDPDAQAAADPAPLGFTNPCNGLVLSNFVDAFASVCGSRGKAEHWAMLYLVVEASTMKNGAKLENVTQAAGQAILNRLATTDKLDSMIASGTVQGSRPADAKVDQQAQPG